MGLFGLAGLMVSSWLSRLPSVRDALGMTPADLGAVLLFGALGALAAVTVAGSVVTRFGGRCSLLLSTVGFSLGYVLLGVGATVGSVVVVAAGVFCNGVSFALGNVPLNVESAGVERRLGRTVLPQFHAVFSIGAVAGSLLGALMAYLGVTLLAQFVGTAVVALVWRLASIPHVVVDTLTVRQRAAQAVADGGPVPEVGAGDVGRRGGSLRTALGAWRERRTLLIGLVVMSAALSEGSASDWLALAVVDGFDQPESVGAVAFGIFVAAMTLVRFLGTRLIDRHGRTAVLRVSGVVSLAGLLMFGLGPNIVVAGIGIAAWGLGAALAVPIGIAAASDDPLRAAGRVSVVSAFASMAHLAAPPLLGLAAETVGARHALLLITGAMVVSVALSGRVARPGERVGDRVGTLPAADRLAVEQDAVLHTSAAEPAVVPMGDTGPVAVTDLPVDAHRPAVPAPHPAPRRRAGRDARGGPAHRVASGTRPGRRTLDRLTHR
jgi:MFS family permease